MSYVIIAAVGVSAGSQIWAANEQAKALEANSEFQSKISELNSQLALIDAREAERQGLSQEVRYSTEIEKVKAEQEAALAQQGVTVQNDATGDLLAESDLIASLNRAEIKNQAYMNAAGFRREAAGIQGQAELNSYQSRLNQRSALISGYAGAIGTVGSAAISSASASNAAKAKQGK